MFVLSRASYKIVVNAFCSAYYHSPSGVSSTTQASVSAIARLPNLSAERADAEAAQRKPDSLLSCRGGDAMSMERANDLARQCTELVREGNDFPAIWSRLLKGHTLI